MAAKRCSVCGINYPEKIQFSILTRCRVQGCNESLDWFEHAEPDEDWEALVAELDAVTERANAVADLIPTVEGEIRERDGELWVSVHDAIRSDARERAEVVDLVRVDGRDLEIVGHRPSTREYLVRPFSLTIDVPVLAEEPRRLLADGLKFAPNVKRLRAERALEDAS